jgi:hypothetical protein
MTVKMYANGSFQSSQFIESSSGPAMKMFSNNTVQIGNLIESIGCGSISFDGSTQYIEADSLPGISGSGNFTIETWVYPTSSALDQMVGSTTRFGDNLQIFRINEGTANGCVSIYDNGIQLFKSIGNYVIPNQWSHLAWVKSGTTNTLFINGTSRATYTGNIPDFIPNLIGCFFYNINPSAYFAGYVTNWRVVNCVAVYTSNFTPPTQPLSATQLSNINGNPSAAITGTSTTLLLDALSSGTYLTDSSTNNFTVTPTNSPTFSTLSPIARINTNQKLYANGSFLSSQFIEQ